MVLDMQWLIGVGRCSSTWGCCSGLFMQTTTDLMQSVIETYAAEIHTRRSNERVIEGLKEELYRCSRSWLL